MGTSLTLLGRTTSSDPLAALEPHLVRKTALAPTASRSTDDRGRPLLAVAIHPAAEPLRVVDAGSGRIEIEAITGTAGPGYHAHVCEALALAADELGITWERVDDESGYFTSRDRGALEQAMLLWLRTTAMEILSLHARGHVALQLSLPEGTTFESAGVVATPMGPRDHAWLAKVAKHPSDGIDVFPWWEPGEGASMLRGTAISAMWIDVRWRAPLTTQERELDLRVVDWLERGHALAPDESWPWREWAELFDLLGESSLRATRTGLRASNLPPAVAIGYRRSPVRVTLSGGWSMRVPGELAERWEERGTWVGWDAQRSIWVSTLEDETSADTDETLAGLGELEGEGEVLAAEHGDMAALARFGPGEEEGRPVITMHAHAALGAHAAIGTIVIERDEDRSWALETWASLSHLDDR